MGLDYEYKTTNIYFILKKSHRQTVNKTVYDQRMGEKLYIAAFCNRARLLLPCAQQAGCSSRRTRSFDKVDGQVIVTTACRMSVTKLGIVWY